MRPLRVAVLGDSFVTGVGDPEGRGWVGRLTASTLAAGVEATLYPLGIRGETTTALTDRWRREVRPRLPRSVDGRVVLAAGYNDPDPARAAAAVLTAARGVRGRRLGVLVLGPPPSPEAGRLADLTALDDALARGCAHHGLPHATVLAPLVADGRWCAEAAAGDGAHPGAGGYAAYADAVWAAGWLDWLTGPSRRSGVAT